MSILFKDLDLGSSLLSALSALGYEEPTQVQQQSIPILLSGTDLLAQAQTGTGKTAAFALPILQRVDISGLYPQSLVITPTRELALQVAEAFQSYAKHLKGFHVMPIYGGQDYGAQLRLLKRGVHVVVGTPGRVMDHMRRGSLDIKSVQTVVLDEADEMLRMGFLEDVEWILGQMEHSHQTALFSATIPTKIKNIAGRFLTEAKEVRVVPTLNKVDLISQSYIELSQREKLDVLTRVLEVKQTQATLIFVRTRNASTELAEKLQARGYLAAALNGDLNQMAREKVVSRIKKGGLDIIVATDVAARGIDVDRINLVVNYDIPYDVEAYIHRIGRTGRAGRQGEALLFVTQRERRLFKLIQSAMGESLDREEPPSREDIIRKRDEKISEEITRLLKYPNKMMPYKELLDSIVEQDGVGYDDVALSLLHLLKRNHQLPVERVAPVERVRKTQERSKSRRVFHGAQKTPSRGFSNKRSDQGESAPAGRGRSNKRYDQGESAPAGRGRSNKRYDQGESAPAGRGRSKQRSDQGESAPAGRGRSKQRYDQGESTPAGRGRSKQRYDQGESAPAGRGRSKQRYDQGESAPAGRLKQRSDQGESAPAGRGRSKQRSDRGKPVS